MAAGSANSCAVLCSREAQAKGAREPRGNGGMLVTEESRAAVPLYHLTLGYESVLLLADPGQGD